jgi:hypothetical protein
MALYITSILIFFLMILQVIIKMEKVKIYLQQGNIPTNLKINIQTVNKYYKDNKNIRSKNIIFCRVMFLILSVGILFWLLYMLLALISLWFEKLGISKKINDIVNVAFFDTGNAFISQDLYIIAKFIFPLIAVIIYLYYKDIYKLSINNFTQVKQNIFFHIVSAVIMLLLLINIPIQSTHGMNVVSGLYSSISSGCIFKTKNPC